MFTRGAFTNKFLFFSLFALFALGLILLGEFVVAQKDCINGASGQIYLDTNYNNIREPDENGISGSISVHARSSGKSIVYDSDDGYFTTGNILCDTYDVKYNSIQVGYFEISEVVSSDIHPFPITPEIIRQSTTRPEQPYQMYLPFVER